MSRSFAILLMVGSLASTAFSQATQNPESAAVRKAIEDHYFKAQSTGDGSALKGTFIEEGKMMWIADGQLRTRPSAEYIAGFSGKPPADEAKRKRRVLMVDVTGDAAVAKAELDYPDVRVIDYFSLLRIGGEWKIVHKTFQREPKPKG